MDADIEYGGVFSDGELAQLAQMVGAAFAVGDRAEGWLAAARAELRVLRRSGALVGGLMRIPMGQYFGGRRVPMTGFAGVVVPPAERGSGAATAIMHEAVRELYREGVALSALYPATMPLYRRAGFELAGDHMRIRVPVHAIELRERAPAMRPMEPGDREALRRCYESVAAGRPGWLARGDYVWNRVFQPRSGDEIHAHVVEGEGIEGYVVHGQKSGPGGRYELALRDLVASTPRAARRLWSFLGSYRSMATAAVWTGGADDPFLHLLGEQHGVSVERVEPWMLRLVDVARALGERGYPAGLRARVELDVADAVVPDNAGPLVLEVEGGSASVERGGGAGSVRLDVRALATLYSGYASAEMLASIGAVEGPPEQLAQLSAIFAGPAPSCPDFF